MIRKACEDWSSTGPGLSLLTITLRPRRRHHDSICEFEAARPTRRERVVVRWGSERGKAHQNCLTIFKMFDAKDSILGMEFTF
jgi:hypothetical protein